MNIYICRYTYQDVKGIKHNKPSTSVHPFEPVSQRFRLPNHIRLSPHLLPAETLDYRPGLPKKNTPIWWYIGIGISWYIYGISW